ncbi:MAG: TetR/AcrR family transcriptional regulator [Pseudomonadota bacterium]
MASKVEERRAALSEKLVDIAEATIAAEGHQGIRARDLAAEAGCAVGAIYTLYADLDHLVMAVNGRTFHRLGAHVATAVLAAASDDPVDQLVVMGQAYLSFAAANPKSWRTLFDLEMSAETDVPDWYMIELGALFDLISRPLSQIYPDQSADQIGLLTRTLFSSVHGIVFLGLEKRLSAVPEAEMAQMIDRLVRAVVS